MPVPVSRNPPGIGGHYEPRNGVTETDQTPTRPLTFGRVGSNFPRLFGVGDMACCNQLHNGRMNGNGPNSHCTFEN